MVGLDEARERARALISFADGLADSGVKGLVETASRSRMVARDVLELADLVDAERSARVAAQANYARCLDVLARRAGEAIGAGSE